MSTDLREELRQQKPFTSLEQEAFLNIVRTDAELSDSFERMLRPFRISGAQYNVLRILRGAESNKLCRNEIRGRLVSRMPDVTRLLDRMEAAGLVTRERSSEDRRLVATHLTDAGRDLVDRLDEAVDREHRATLGHMGEGQLRKLIELLTLARRRQ